MKVIVDTNILVLAILRNRLPEQIVAYVASRPNVQWIVTAAIVAEYKGVLSRSKFGISAEELARQFAFIENHTVVVEVLADIEFPRDHKDAKFLACAKVVNADFLITDDHDFAEASPIVATRIVTVTAFAHAVGLAET